MSVTVHRVAGGVLGVSPPIVSGRWLPAANSREGTSMSDRQDHSPIRVERLTAEEDVALMRDAAFE